MSEERHIFRVSSVWTGNSDGDGVSEAGTGVRTEFGIPPATGGKEGRTNPEELLLNAVVACYSITLALLIERKRLAPHQIEVAAEGDLVRQPDRTLKFTAIRLKPRILAAGADEAQRQTLLDLAHKAERYCLISNAVRGNVEVSLEPEVLTT
jgi:peroxiredoxin-like protein